MAPRPLLVLALLTASLTAPARAEGALAVHATPAFSPNGDGRIDEATIEVVVPSPGPVSIRILRDGVEHRRFDAVSAGEAVEVAWDGEDALGTALPDGPYLVEATFGDIVTETATASTRIDTKRPSIAWTSIRPSPATGRSPIRFGMRVSDASPTVTATLRAQDAFGVIAKHRTEIATGNVTIRWRPRRGGSLYPGTYRALVGIEDEAGNLSAVKRKPFRIERGVRAKVFNRLPRAGRRVALTIDDCHSRSAWSSMLRTLRKARVKATFFCPGDRLAIFSGLARKTVRQGHTLGSHGWDHAVMSGASTRKFRLDSRMAWRLTRTTTAPYFRPPYGAYDAGVVRAAGATGHGRVMMWDVDAFDSRTKDPGTILRNVVRPARSGSVILMHTVTPTARALPGIIRGLRARGLEPVSLPRLFRAAGYR